MVEHMMQIQIAGIYVIMGIIWVWLFWASSYGPSLKGAAKEMGDLAFKLGVPIFVMMWPILFVVWLYDVIIVFCKAFKMVYFMRMSSHCLGERCAMDNCTCPCEDCTLLR